MDVMDEQDFTIFDFNMSFERISYLHNPRIIADNIACFANSSRLLTYWDRNEIMTDHDRR